MSRAPGPSRRLDRRAFLRGAGALVALPWLESLAFARARPRGWLEALQRPVDVRRPTRLAVLYMPNGAWPAAWNPASPAAADGVDRDWKLTPTLAPLAPIKGDVIVLGGLMNANSVEGDGHYAKTAPFLTGAAIRRTGGRDLHNGVSMDQVAAAAQGEATPLPSLELGCEPVRPAEDMGYTTVYGGHISWRTPTTPATKEIVPRLVFDRMFRSSARRAGPGERSVLDVVRDDAKRLDARLGAADRGKLAEYQDAVHDLERRIDRCASVPAADVDASLRPADGLPHRHADHVELLLDLVALAFRSDTTRVATFMFGNAVSGIDMSFLDGVKGGHHELSHHENRVEKTTPYQLINRWHVLQFARFAAKLAAIEERPAGAADDGAATVLDRSMVLFGSAMKDGNAHDPHDLPLLLAGKGLGHAAAPLPVGTHRRFAPGTRLCDLYVTLLRRMGVACDSFGDSAGALLA